MTNEVTKVLNVMAERFTSGNNVPVERAQIMRAEWDAVVAELMSASVEPRADAADYEMVRDLYDRALEKIVMAEKYMTLESRGKFEAEWRRYMRDQFPENRGAERG